MYTQSGYPTSHPPMIGFSLDGFKIYGRFLDTSACVSFDLCGGYSHGSFGFHTEVEKINATNYGQQMPYGTPFYLFLPGISNCNKNYLFPFFKNIYLKISTLAFQLFILFSKLRLERRRISDI
jgi:hypothetical protein